MAIASSSQNAKTTHTKSERKIILRTQRFRKTHLYLQLKAVNDVNRPYFWRFAKPKAVPVAPILAGSLGCMHLLGLGAGRRKWDGMRKHVPLRTLRLRAVFLA